MPAVSADPTKCIGSGVCEAIAAAVFEVGDDNVVHVRSTGEEHADDIRAAVLACPTGALTIADPDPEPTPSPQ